ncbi:MAG: zinc metallopeptidase [Candidatus Bipolaricaulota bacterium]|nr:MAG: zinc metallopeptidase [Candidatus Bipolaricaulota bacterium]
MGPSILILIPALLLAGYAQFKVRSTYGRYERVRTADGISAGSAAERILAAEGISDVRIERAKRRLSDHYDPRARVLRLSNPGSVSVAAVGVAAHEAGHAIQHARGYRPLALRTSIVPVATLGSQLALPLLILGILFRFEPLISVGILAFSAAVLFTLITLPVEFNASRRAVAALRSGALVNTEELGAVREVLFAAALTYVAAAAVAALQLLLLLTARRR